MQHESHLPSQLSSPSTSSRLARKLRASARDDIIDVFDVVFGDLQRSATNRGKKRRAGELTDYDQAVGELQARMRPLLDALDESDHVIAAALGCLRTDRERIEAALSVCSESTRENRQEAMHSCRRAALAPHRSSAPC